MKESIVTFQTAKLAKKKGFNELVRHCFLQDAKLYGTISLLKDDDAAFIDVMDGNELEYHNHKDFDRYSAPTQSLLQKWLREVHNIHLVVKPRFKGDSTNPIVDYTYNDENGDGNNIFYPTYEEALEIGLQEALKLI